MLQKLHRLALWKGWECLHCPKATVNTFTEREADDLQKDVPITPNRYFQISNNYWESVAHSSGNSRTSGKHTDQNMERQTEI